MKEEAVHVELKEKSSPSGTEWMLVVVRVGQKGCLCSPSGTEWMLV